MRIELHSRSSRSREDAAPVGIAASESGFHERRSCDRLRDLTRRCFALRATYFDFDHALRAFAVGNDLQRERMADIFECSREIAMRFRARSDCRSARLTVGQHEQRIVGRSVTIDRDRVERSLRYIAQYF